MIPIALILALGALATAGLLWGEYRDNRLLVWLCKPLASVCVLAIAWILHPASSLSNHLMLVGIGFAVLGDILLIPRSSSSFLWGIGAFLGTHLCYIAAYVSHPAFAGLAWMPALVVIGVAAAILRWLWSYLGALRYIVPVYVTALGSMVITAWSLAMSPAMAARPAMLVAIGATSFMTSDLAVARHRFVKKQFINKLWGLPLWFAAQLILVWAMASW